jgi:Ca2+:H+ antiporter
LQDFASVYWRRGDRTIDYTPQGVRLDVKRGLDKVATTLKAGHMILTQPVTASAQRSTPLWTVLAPVLGSVIAAGAAAGIGGYFAILVALGLAAGVFAAIHHAETVALRIGEPFGTLVLALAVTLLELSLVGSVMLTGRPDTAALARDTVFATVMIILNGIVGLSLLVGGLHHRAQEFSLDGVSAALVALGAITVMTLVFPNFTDTVPGPFYSPSQLILVAVVSVVIYGAFIITQTIVHRPLFIEYEPDVMQRPEFERPSAFLAYASAGLLLICLLVVVVSAHDLAPLIEANVAAWGAPDAIVGVIIAVLVLLPEGLAALRAARQNRLQTSLNLALGSALASIGLTIPAISILSIFIGVKLVLGIDMKSVVLLVLSLFTTTLVLRTGRTMILHGVVLLVLLIVYLFLTVVP